MDTNVDVDHTENKDVGMGKHKKAEHRQDEAVRLDVDPGEMSITGKDAVHGKDADQRKNKDQTVMATVSKAQVKHREGRAAHVSAWLSVATGFRELNFYSFNF